jgi:hypothetical protein
VIVIKAVIECDRCGAVEPLGDFSAENAKDYPRADALDRGWQQVDKLWHCPHCNKKKEK